MNFSISLKDLKNDLILKENIFYLIVIGFIFLLDRVSKISVLNNFNERTYYINDFINLDLIWNTGIGFGIFSTDSSLLYNCVSALVVLIIIILLFVATKSKTSEKIIFSIIIGGAIGNLYDRLIYNAVPDFIDLHYNNFHWFTFNVADIFITIGILIFMIKSFFTNE